MGSLGGPALFRLGVMCRALLGQALESGFACKKSRARSVHMGGRSVTKGKTKERDQKGDAALGIRRLNPSDGGTVFSCTPELA